MLRHMKSAFAVRVFMVLMFGFFLPGGRAVAQTNYSITNLGTLGGETSNAFGINNSGQVVGTADTGVDGAGHAFLYSNGVMTDLHTFVGRDSYALKINNVGQIVGYESTGNFQAFLYSGGVTTNLDFVCPYTGSFGYGINDSGRVLVNCSNAAFIYSSGTIINIGNLSGPNYFGYTFAYDINLSGQVVGASNPPNSPNFHAFLYNGGTMVDLGTLGGPTSVATAINDAGQVVGISDTSTGQTHPFLYSGGVMQDLGSLSSFGRTMATSINNVGQIVGFFDTSGDIHAFLYSNGTFTDLNDLIPAGTGWILEVANDINDAGQIVGSGQFGSGYPAFLLTPPASPPQLIGNLVVTVQTLNITQNISNSLDAKLQNALAALNDSRSGNTVSACGRMQSFVNEVNAQTGKSITSAQANQLIGAASQIETSLGCR